MTSILDGTKCSGSSSHSSLPLPLLLPLLLLSFGGGGADNGCGSPLWCIDDAKDGDAKDALFAPAIVVMPSASPPVAIIVILCCVVMWFAEECRCWCDGTSSSFGKPVSLEPNQTNKQGQTNKHKQTNKQTNTSLSLLVSWRL